MSIVFKLAIPSANTNIMLPVKGSVNVTIDWNDGNIISYTSINPSHTYANAGTYNISLTGSFTQLRNDSPNINYSTYLTGFEYNIQIPALTNFLYAFANTVNNFTISIANNTITNNVTLMSNMFESSAFNNPLTNLNTSSVTEMEGMFYNASAFNQPVSFDTSKVTVISGMFMQASGFNQPLSFNTSNVTDMGGMFQYASRFNQSLSFSNTSKVIYMIDMFSGATAFNQDISSWNISSLQYAANMFTNSSFSSSNYNKLLVSWGNQSIIRNNVILGASNIKYTTSFAKSARDILTNTYAWNITDGGYTAPYPCFKEGSKILTNNGYKSIETLRTGDLIQTLQNGFKPIYKIGKRELYHSALKHRIKEQLYRFSKEKYPEIFEDLVLTGCHSILVENFENEEQKQKAIDINSGRLCVTDGRYRLPACLVTKASIYENPGTYTIYHFALENDDYIMNYGVYANGLLVETCSKRYLNEFSGMTIIS